METSNTEVKEKSEGLHDLLNQATEEKKGSEIRSKLWSEFDEDTPAEKTASTSEVKKDNPKEDVKSEKKKEENQRASGETLTSVIDAGLDILLSFFIDYRFKNNFDENEWNKLLEIIDKNISDLEGKDLELRNKYDRLKPIRDKRISRLPFEKDETDRLNRIFYNYYKVTNKELSPEILLWMGLGSAVLEKARAVLLD